MAVCTQKVKGQIHMKNLIWPSFNTVAQRQHDLCAEGNSRKEVILMFMLFYALFVDLKKNGSIQLARHNPSLCKH